MSCIETYKNTVIGGVTFVFQNKHECHLLIIAEFYY